MLFHGEQARGVRLPLDLEPGGLEDPDNGACDFGADAVARDQRDGVFHDERFYRPPTAYAYRELVKAPGFPVEKHQRSDDIGHHQLRRELMQLVKTNATRISCGQSRGQTADLLLDRIDLVQNDEARVQSDEQHQRHDGRADGEATRPRPEQRHRRERHQCCGASAVCNVVKPREDRAKDGATENTTRVGDARLKNLKCRGRHDRA